jgi:hypothetical protein
MRVEGTLAFISWLAETPTRTPKATLQTGAVCSLYTHSTCRMGLPWG